MKKTKLTIKKTLALTLCLIMAFSCFALGGVYAEGTHTHSYGDWVVDIPATCSQMGVKHKTCLYDDCGDTVTAYIAANSKAHTYEGEWVVSQPATCTAKGTKENVCKDCGKTVTSSIPMLEHTFNESLWEVFAPVHTADDVQDGFRKNSCTVCGEVVTQTIAVEHTVDLWSTVSEGTCSDKGVQLGVCTVCGETASRYTEMNPDVHTFSSAPECIKEATCHSEGEGYNRCDECGKVVKVVIPVDLNNHVYDYDDVHEYDCSFVTIFCKECNAYIESETIHTHTVADDAWTILGNPSCTKMGEKIGECSVCGRTITVKIPTVEDAHSYGAWEVLKSASCQEEGLRVRVCKYNYGHKVYDVLEKKAHKYKTEWEVIEEPTCSTEGKKENFCVTCQQYITEAIPVDKDAHDLVNAQWNCTKEPTCTSVGYEENECKICGDVTREIPMHSFTYSEYDRKEPNCTYEGEIYVICTECSHHSTLPIPVKEDAHSYYVKTAPTCSKEGLKVCKHNDEHNIVLAIDPDAHTYPDKWTYSTDCTKAGVKSKTCTGCGHTISESYEAGHDVGDWTFVIGNCSVGGTMTKHCKKCGALIEEKNAAAGDHAFKVLDTVAPTCTKQGYDVAECTCCGEEFQINIKKATNHNIIVLKQGYPATCTEDGLTDIVKCTKCDYRVDVQSTIKATGHNFVLQENGTHSCTKCFEHLVNGDEANPATCSCICHNQDGLAKFFFKILLFFFKLFGMNQSCECGVVHY